MHRSLTILLIPVVGFLTMGCDDKKKEGGEANIVVKEPLPTLQVLSPANAGVNTLPPKPKSSP